MRSTLLAPIGVALLMGGLSSAVSIRPLSLQELCAGAEDIVYGQVEQVESYWVDQRIETLVTLATFETWKGTAREQVQIRVPGGTVGNITMKCCEAPTFHQKDKVVCFLRTREGAKEVFGWFRGQYTVIGNTIREMPNTTLASMRASVQATVTEVR
jgi:hypothetical protein